MEKIKIYVKANEDGSLFANANTTEEEKNIDLLFKYQPLFNIFRRIDWKGVGGNLSEEHGVFLSKLTELEKDQTNEFIAIQDLSLLKSGGSALLSIDEKRYIDGGEEQTFVAEGQIFVCSHSVINFTWCPHKTAEYLLHCIYKIYKETLGTFHKKPNGDDSSDLLTFVWDTSVEYFREELRNSNIELIMTSEKKEVEKAEEVESLSLLDSLVVGKIAKLNGEFVQAIDFLSHERTSKKLVIPKRFDDYYAETKEEVKHWIKKSSTIFKEFSKNAGQYSFLKSYVPTLDPTFVFNREEYKDWVRLFAHPGFNITLLSGDSGVGKSELVQNVCALMNVPLVRVDFSGEVIAEQILWSQNYNPETKKMEVVEGIIPFCARNGIKLCLEEFSSIPPTVAFELHRLFEKGSIYIKDNDTLITPHPQFSIVLTDNRIGNPNFQKYFGTQQQNSALISRIKSCIWIPYPNKKTEREYLSLKFVGLDSLKVVDEKDESRESKYFLDLVIDFANDIRPKYENGELGFTMSPRDIVSLFENYYKLEDLKKAFEYSILNFNKNFKSDTEAIKDLFDKYFGKNPAVKNEKQIKKIEYFNFN